MAKVKVKRNTGMNRKIIKNLKQVTKNKIHVGFLNGEMHAGPRSDMTNASLALLQEYGSLDLHIPARPFMSSSLGSKQFMRPIILKSAKGLLYRPNSVIREIGKSSVQGLRTTMDDWSVPPNAEMTKARKGGISNPLIETGSLRDSASYELRSKRIDP